MKVFNKRNQDCRAAVAQQAATEDCVGHLVRAPVPEARAAPGQRGCLGNVSADSASTVPFGGSLGVRAQRGIPVVGPREPVDCALLGPWVQS